MDGGGKMGGVWEDGVWEDGVWEDGVRRWGEKMGYGRRRVACSLLRAAAAGG